MSRIMKLVASRLVPTLAAAALSLLIPAALVWAQEGGLDWNGDPMEGFRKAMEDRGHSFGRGSALAPRGSGIRDGGCGRYWQDPTHDYSSPYRYHSGPHSGYHWGPYQDSWGGYNYGPHYGYHWGPHGSGGHGGSSQDPTHDYSSPYRYHSGPHSGYHWGPYQDSWGGYNYGPHYGDHWGPHGSSGHR